LKETIFTGALPGAPGFLQQASVDDEKVQVEIGQPKRGASERAGTGGSGGNPGTDHPNSGR